MAPLAPIDAESLRSYLLVMLHAWQVGETDTFQTLTDGLKLPDAKQWLISAFGPGQADALKDKYDRSFLHFQSNLIWSFKREGTAGAELSVEPYHASKGVSAPISAPTPRAPIEIFSFKFVLGVKGKGRTEWMDSYLTVNGKLRYIGGGIHPFWIVPSIHVERVH